MNEQETIEDIIVEMRKDKRVDPNLMWDNSQVEEHDLHYADRLDAAHRREMNALKQRRTELDAEVAAKDEVIKRLNNAIAEEQRRKMTTTENSSAVGNAAKLREAAEKTRATLEEALQILNGISDEEAGTLNARLEDVADEICEVTQWIIPDALAAPPRNCDVGVPEERIQRWSKFCKARSKKLPPIHGFEWEDYPYESEVKEGGNNGNE